VRAAQANAALEDLVPDTLAEDGELEAKRLTALQAAQASRCSEMLVRLQGANEGRRAMHQSSLR
jgi:hypothetical protein